MNIWTDFDARLQAALKPVAPPIAITFLATPDPNGPPRLANPIPAPNPRGRTGRVAAGCVFWMEAVDKTFSTAKEDHGNCSVGSFTHGLISLEEAAQRDDVEAVFASGWVSPAAAAGIPQVTSKPAEIWYGPLSDAVVTPDVVLCRVNGLGLMTLKDAFDDLVIEGKPQCHIVAVAKEHGRIAASVGCALSRARTGMKSQEMTCALPGRRLEEIVDTLERVSALDRAMARYAAEDNVRFA